MANGTKRDENSGAEETEFQKRKNEEREWRRDGRKRRLRAGKKTQKRETTGEIERNASKLETVGGRGDRVRQRERNSRGGSGGRVVVLWREKEDKFSEGAK